MQRDSLWMNTVEMPRFPAPDRDMQTEVLVVGGGLTGVLCAFRLQRLGIPYVLCEAKRVGLGATGRSTAVLSLRHDAAYPYLVKHHGEKGARRYLAAQRKALGDYRSLADKGVEFDFEEKPSVFYAQKPETAEKLRREARLLNELGYPAEIVSKIDFPVPHLAALRLPDGAQMHPLKFLATISKDLRIYENALTDHIDLKSNTARAGNHRIAFKKLIVATRFPILDSRGLYFMKLYQNRSYVLALENAGDSLPDTYVCEEKHGMYFRSYGRLLLVGGGDHRTGKKGGGYDALRAFVRTVYPAAREAYAWATQDCVGLDGIPYIGRYSPGTPHVFTATGFNEWGMTSAMIAAELLTDLVSGNKNPFEDLFAPNRGMLHPQLLCNLGTTLADFATPTAKRCSHLGCALKRNEAERSWDCPCHGSRFDESGEPEDNPALRRIRID